MFQIIDRITEEVITCAEEEDCPENCVLVLPAGTSLVPTPEPPPEGYAFVYTNYGSKVYVGDPLRVLLVPVDDL